jgi:drug/metabolite transporter (DMT)-like permease
MSRAKNEPARRRFGIALIIVAAACYGAMPIFARFAYAAGTDPVTLLFLRFSIATPVMLVLLAVRRAPFPRGRTLLLLIGLGAVLYVAQSLCYFTALTLAPASLVALLLFLYPVIVAAAASVLYRERFTPGKGIALVLAVSGAVLMIGFVTGGTPAGIALGIGAAIIYSLYILSGTKIMKTVSPLSAAAVVIASTALVYAAVAVVRGPVLPSTLAGWLSVAAIAVVSTVIAVAAFLAGLERIGPTNASTLSTLEPVVSTALAALLLGEPFTPFKIAGGALILAAVILISRTAAS